MRLSENRPLAWVVLIACALGSVVGLGGAGLARERDRVERAFYDGAVESNSTARSSCLPTQNSEKSSGSATMPNTITSK